jgi:putative ATP-binding cassette transporter
VPRPALTLAKTWRLTAPYFRSEHWRGGCGLLASVIAIELFLVGINVALNEWNNRFYNALQNHNWHAFVTELLFFCCLAAAYILLTVYQLYLNQWLQIGWRRWMTRSLLGNWLSSANHYRMQLLGDAADNPDQRIAEDINLFVERALSIGVGLLGSVVTLVSFVVILWGLSAQAPLQLFGTTLSIPGYLVWAALSYAAIGTLVTHFIGWRLIGLNFEQQRFEADFRFDLVRVRENAEQIALLRGETTERKRLLGRFGSVVVNWFAIMRRQKKLTFFTASYNQVSIVFPFVVVSPAYFAGAIQLGGLMQTAAAFNSVQGALSFFITIYRQLAEWQAVIERLNGFERAIAEARAIASDPTAIQVKESAGRSAIEIADLLVRLPNGVPLLEADCIVLRAGDRVLVTGPSGSGKSTLFRAIAGVWPCGRGDIILPRRAHVMMLPQRPYLPIASLMAAVAYPAEPESFGAERLADVVMAVGLGTLVGRLEEEAHWNRVLSLGEQQRLGLARAILHVPDYLFLDEATASLDEPAEAALYRLLQQRLPATTIISTGHRSTLATFHRRQLSLVREGDRMQLRESEPVNQSVTVTMKPAT